MTRQFLRACTLSLSGSSSLKIPGGGPKDLRIEASIGATTLQAPNPARFRITNPNPQTIAAFKNKEFATLDFEGGYVDNAGPLYSGDIKQSLYAHAEDNVTSYIDVFCAGGGNAYQQSRVGKTLAAGWTPMDKAQIALDAMKPFGVTGLGLVNVDLSQPQYPRGRPFVGMARDLLRQVALSAGATWSIQDGKIDMLDHRKPVDSGGPVVLNSATGLVGWPQQTEDGIIARCLINPAIKVHTQVKIDQAQINGAERDNTFASGFGVVGDKQRNLDNTGQIAADGLYRVLYMEIELDSRGVPWYQTLTCLATNATPNEGQVSSGMVQSF